MTADSHSRGGKTDSDHDCARDQNQNADATARDQAWAAALDLLESGRGRLTVGDVADHASLNDSQRATARNPLNGMAALGRLDHADGSPYWTRPHPTMSDTDPAVTVLRDRNHHKWTFQDPEIKAWTEQRLEGRTLNLFAGRTRLTHPEGDAAEIVTNDKSAFIRTDYCFDAEEVADHFPENSFQTVLLDPPWGKGVTTARSKDCYGNVVDDYSMVKDGIARVLRPGGRVISFGYSSSGMGRRRGFALEELAAIHFSGNSHDVMATVERERGKAEA